MDDSAYEQKWREIINNYKDFLFLIDHQAAAVFSSTEQMTNVDTLLPLKATHLVSTGAYLQQKVKYFSLTDVIKSSISRTDIQCSRAYEIQQLLDKKTIVINSQVKHDFVIEIIGKNQAAYEEDWEWTPYVSFQEFAQMLKKYCPGLFSVLLGSKILSSSFFFSEFIDVFGYEGELSILKDKFFQSFNSFKAFANSIQYSAIFTTFEQQNSFEESVIYLSNKLHVECFEPIPYVVFQKDNLFCNKALLFHDYDNQNTNFFTKNIIEVVYKTPFKRELLLDGQHAEMYQSAYDFYMYHVLKLKRKSINALIIKNIYNSLIDAAPIDKNLILNNEVIEVFINKLRCVCEFSDRHIIYKKNELFLAFTSYEVNKIKTYARSKNFQKIHIANLKTFSIDEINLRSPKKRDKIKVIY